MIGTLGGIRFMPAGGHGSGTLAVREVAALPPPVPAMRGAIWDKRFRLETDEIVPKYVWIGALGDDVRKFSRQSKLGFAILCTLPALRDENGLVAVPHLGYFRGWTNPRLRLTFCPSDPVAGAPFQPYTLGDAQTAQAHHVLDEAGTAHPGVPDGPAGIF
jgi:tRNA(Ile)-lysidine synthase